MYLITYISNTNISENCNTLKLGGILQCYQSIADECGKLNASYSEYLDQILKHELMLRKWLDSQY